MANIRVKDLDTKASFASDDEILMDSPSGTGTMLRDAFISAVASQIVAAPSTYKIATLDGANKLTSSQDPSQSVSYLGGHDMVANSPALADGSGTAGDTYYVTNPGTRNYGSGNITAQEGDALVYSGSVWQLVEGIANILDGISTASTARTTLEVNSIDEDAQANGTKVTAPALYFNGSSSVVTVAHDAKQHFNNGTDDLPFSISFWVNTDFAVAGGLVSKYQSGAKEFVAWVTGSGLRFNLSDGTDEPYIQTASLTAYSNKWTHVTITSEGAGPNYSNDFPAAIDSLKVYVNAVDITSGATKQNESAYGGLNNSSAAMTLMSFSGGNFKKGSIRDVKIFNRELTASEIAELARGNDLGFSEEWAGALGGAYTSDFSAGADSFGGGNGTAAGNIDSIGGEDDNLRLTIDTTANAHAVYRSSVFTANKRYRVDFDFYIPSSNTALDGLIAYCGTSDIVEIGSYASPSLDAWNRFSGEFVATATANADRLIVYATDGGSTGFSDGGAGTDVLYIRNITVTEIGTLADFRAEDYNESASKLLDRSSNNFVGVGTSVTLTGNQRHISADTIDLKNLPTSSAGLSAGEVWSNGGVLTVV